MDKFGKTLWLPAGANRLTVSPSAKWSGSRIELSLRLQSWVSRIHQLSFFTAFFDLLPLYHSTRYETSFISGNLNLHNISSCVVEPLRYETIGVGTRLMGKSTINSENYWIKCTTNCGLKFWIPLQYANIVTIAVFFSFWTRVSCRDKCKLFSGFKLLKCYRTIS